MDDEFRQELEKLLNKHSKENRSETPDAILAEYLVGCLEIFDRTIILRTKWYNNTE